MNNKIVTIHQPDFMPWIGFFNKIEKADVFVVLDHVTNKYNVRNWLRRVNFNINCQKCWLSVSLKKTKPSHIPISCMEVNDNIDYTKKLKSIRQSYQKTKYFDDIYPLITNWFDSDENKLSKRNMLFIKTIMNLLDIKTEIIYSSDLNCNNKSTDLLIEIIKKINGGTYLCGSGAAGYQEDKKFHYNEIEVNYNNFKPPVYRQYNNKGEFISGLSIVDCLMNIGIDDSKKMVKRVVYNQD